MIALLGLLALGWLISEVVCAAIVHAVLLRRARRERELVGRDLALFRDYSTRTRRARCCGLDFVGDAPLGECPLCGKAIP